MQLKKTKEIKRGNGGKGHKHKAKELTSQEALLKKKNGGRVQAHNSPWTRRDCSLTSLNELSMSSVP